MTSHSGDDVRRALEVVGSVGDSARPEPFGAETLLLLGELVGAETVGYCETPRSDGFGEYEVVTRERPGWFREALRRLAREDPTHPVFRGDSPAPVAISELTGRRSFRTTAMYETIFEPFGMEDSIRLYLPAPRDQARFFFLDRPVWGLRRGERELLDCVRTHLVAARNRWSPSRDVPGPLTHREAQIVRMLAAGLTNAEIAHRLWLSPHTVRTHLEHAYSKLGVHTRVQAAKAILAVSPQTGRGRPGVP